MKNIVDSSSPRYLKLVSLFCYRVKDLKWPKEFRFKFPILFGFDVFAIQPDFVTRDIAFWLCTLIVHLLLKILSVLEIFTANGHEILKF